MTITQYSILEVDFLPPGISEPQMEHAIDYYFRNYGYRIGKIKCTEITPHERGKKLIPNLRKEFRNYLTNLTRNQEDKDGSRN